MISKVMQDAINEQINKELYSSYIYLSMAAYFESESLPGFGNWLRIQAAEENEHAMKLYDYLLERGGKVELKAIAAPKAGWSSALEAVEQVLEHEQFVTKSIHDLYELAVQEKDYPTQVMLHWFIEEQVEEEASATAILDSMKRIESHQTAILMLDHRLSKRKGDED
ncbi:MAG: ferritin [Anaerolineales bacterium]